MCRFTIFLTIFSVVWAGCERSTAVHDGDAGDAGEWDFEPGDSDAQEDIADPDVSDPDITDPDITDPDITDPDGEDVSSSFPAPPAEILRTGGGGLLLRGVVLTPAGVLDPGEVLVSGNAIVCVDRDCSFEPEAEGATWIDTHGVISPGLVDAHNHLAYNFLPEWVPDPPQLFQNRYEWADMPDYEAFIAPYANHRSSSTHFCPAAKWGELRSLIHATTTVQGQSFAQRCVDWCVRNADNYDDLGYDQMRTTIASPRDITDAEAQSYVDSFNDPVEPVTRLAVHMAEGYAGNYVTEEFDSFAGRDPRTNRHQGISLLTGGVGLLIHSIPLTESQLQEALETDSKIVWSPSSNMVLYGRTAPIQRMLQMGITVALGPDWTPAGEDEMLSEMRFAQSYGRSSAIEEITPERLWRMATLIGAVAVGLESFVGRLEAGLRADIAVFGRMGDDPYQALIDSRAEDVRLVLIDGQGWYGDLYLKDATARNEYCEQFSACELEKYLCVQESPTAPDRRNETLEDIRIQLYNILEGIGYPPEEQYGRGAELLPLVDCEP
jgi:5-methylthioadenosine/S-adenosylhomocysteine deaminase